MVVSLPAGDRPADPSAITELVRKRLSRARLESVSQTDRETVVSYTFQGFREDALSGLQADLGAAVPRATYNIFFNRPGAL